jgi:hypothetical protein
LLGLLAVGVAVAFVSCGWSGSAAVSGCGAPSTMSAAPRANGPGSAGGSARQTPGTAPPPAPSSPAAPPPTPSGGSLLLTAANSRQTVKVPAGTVVEVRLEPVDGSHWTVPESSDPRALPRMSASGPCDPVATAAFRADGTGRIEASRPVGDAAVRFVIDVVVSG